MRLLDLFANFLQENRDLSELERLYSRLARFNGATEERRRALCSAILERVFLAVPQAAHPQIRKAATALLQGILRFDGLFTVTPGNITGERSTAKVWEATVLARRELALFEDRVLAGQIEEVLIALLHNIIPDYLPPFAEDMPPQLHAPLYALCQQPALAVEAAIGAFLTNQKSKELFPRLWQQLELNLLSVSGINPNRESSKQIIAPTKAKGMTAEALVSEYLGQTPLADYFETSVPFSIPLSARFAQHPVKIKQIGEKFHGMNAFVLSPEAYASILMS